MNPIQALTLSLKIIQDKPKSDVSFKKTVYSLSHSHSLSMQPFHGKGNWLKTVEIEGSDKNSIFLYFENKIPYLKNTSRIKSFKESYDYFLSSLNKPILDDQPAEATTPDGIIRDLVHTVTCMLILYLLALI